LINSPQRARGKSLESPRAFDIRMVQSLIV
jgi:hypothetical protein